MIMKLMMMLMLMAEGTLDMDCNVTSRKTTVVPLVVVVAVAWVACGAAWTL